MSIQVSPIYLHVYELFMYSFVYVFIYFVCLQFNLFVSNQACLIITEYSP